MTTASPRTMPAYTEVRMSRTSVSLPVELHATLERIAKEKKVSMAWVLRDAAEKYVGDQWPLFAAKR